MSDKKPFENTKWFIGILIPIAGIIVGLLNPDIRQWLGLEASALCMKASCAEDYAKVVKRAKKNLSSFEHNTPVQFPIGINKPLTLKPGEKTGSLGSGLQAVGYVTNNQVPQRILVKDLHEMFDRHYGLISDHDSSSQLPSFPPFYVSNNHPFTLVSSNSPPVINLLVYDPQTDKYYELPNVNYISFLKDAINACLNNDITEQNDSP